jgi:hypothetical protein
MNGLNITFTWLAVMVALALGLALSVVGGWHWRRVTHSPGPDAWLCTCDALTRAEREAAYWRKHGPLVRFGDELPGDGGTDGLGHPFPAREH